MSYIAIIAVFSAFIVKGMCGFANTLVFSTIMSFSTDNIRISPIELLVGYPSNLIIAWRERKHIAVKVALPLSIMVMAGSIPGMLFLKNGDTSVVKLLFGIVVVAIGFEMMYREYTHSTKEAKRWVMIGIGILSGFLCGLFGIGALLAAYVGRTTSNSKEFRGNICLVFVVENTFRIIMYSLTGILTLSLWKEAVLLLPVMLAGLGFGILLGKKLKEATVKKVVIVMLIISGVSLIYSNL